MDPDQQHIGDSAAAEALAEQVASVAVGASGGASWTARLDQHLKPLRELVFDAWLSLAASDDFRERFPLFLIETYHYVKHSVPLMGLACARLDYRQLPVVRYFGRHIDEEAGHDGWLLDDLERLGWRRDRVIERPPLPETLLMVGLQRQNIEDGRPLSLLGYIYALEAVPWSKTYLEQLQRDCDLPQGCLSALIAHAEEDPGHGEEIRRLLDHQVTDATVRRAIASSAQTTLDLVARLYNAVEDL
jgi:pyrroloquinoline quinone (PQQ) biosynthesis protein C